MKFLLIFSELRQRKTNYEIVIQEAEKCCSVHKDEVYEQGGSHTRLNPRRAFDCFKNDGCVPMNTHLCFAELQTCLRCCNLHVTCVHQLLTVQFTMHQHHAPAVHHAANFQRSECKPHVMCAPAAHHAVYHASAVHHAANFQHSECKPHVTCVPAVHHEVHHAPCTSTCTSSSPCC